MIEYLSSIIYIIVFTGFVLFRKYLQISPMDKFVKWQQEWYRLHSPTQGFNCNQLFPYIMEQFLLYKGEDIHLQKASRFILKNKKPNSNHLTNLFEIIFSTQGWSAKKNYVVYIGIMSVITVSFIFNNLLFFITDATAFNIFSLIIYNIVYILFFSEALTNFQNYLDYLKKKNQNKLELSYIYSRICSYTSIRRDENITKELNKLSPNSLDKTEVKNYIELLMLYAVKDDFSNVNESTYKFIKCCSKSITEEPTWLENLISIKEGSTN